MRIKDSNKKYIYMQKYKQQFNIKFGVLPDKFKGINHPYTYMGDEKAELLLKYFGFCPQCIGSGTAWAECCDGYNCSCHGDSVAYTCQNCNGTGNYIGNTNNNIEYLVNIASNNNGRLIF